MLEDISLKMLINDPVPVIQAIMVVGIQAFMLAITTIVNLVCQLVRTIKTFSILWDDQQCDGYEGPCCNSSSLPWFYRRLNEQTRDDIEMRICAHEGTSIDDTPIDVVELYIR